MRVACFSLSGQMRFSSGTPPDRFFGRDPGRGRHGRRRGNSPHRWCNRPPRPDSWMEEVGRRRNRSFGHNPHRRRRIPPEGRYRALCRLRRPAPRGCKRCRHRPDHCSHCPARRISQRSARPVPCTLPTPFPACCRIAVRPGTLRHLVFLQDRHSNSGSRRDCIPGRPDRHSGCPQVGRSHCSRRSRCHCR